MQYHSYFKCLKNGTWDSRIGPIAATVIDPAAI